MKYVVYLDSVYDGVNGILHESYQEWECKQIVEVLAKAGVRAGYGEDERPNTGLTKEVRGKVIDWLVNMDYNSHDSDCIRDWCEYGLTGYANLTDKELLENIEQFEDEEDCELNDIIAEARAQLVIEEVLS